MTTSYSSNLRSDSAWIGVDLDGTLAQYTHGSAVNEIGEPIEPMMTRVREWISEGKTVKIFTARAAIPQQVAVVKAWLVQNGLPRLEVTNAKDFGMIELWDDRCIQVNANTGMPVAEKPKKSSSRLKGGTRVLQQRARNGSRPISKLLLAIGRFASTWNQVPSSEFMPTSSGRR